MFPSFWGFLGGFCWSHSLTAVASKIEREMSVSLMSDHMWTISAQSQHLSFSLTAM